MAIILKDPGSLEWDAKQVNPYDAALVAAAGIEKSVLGVQNRFNAQKTLNIAQEQDARDYEMKVAEFDAANKYRTDMMNNAAAEKIASRDYMAETRRLNQEMGLAKLKADGNKITLADLKAKDIVDKKKIVGITGNIVKEAEASPDPDAYLRLKIDEANVSGNPEAIRAVNDAKIKIQENIAIKEKKFTDGINDYTAATAKGDTETADVVLAKILPNLPAKATPPMAYDDVMRYPATKTEKVRSFKDSIQSVIGAIPAFAPFSSLLDSLTPKATKATKVETRIAAQEAKLTKQISDAAPAAKPALIKAKANLTETLRGVTLEKDLARKLAAWKKQHRVY